jgi:hypothetical protein
MRLRDWDTGTVVNAAKIALLQWVNQMMSPRQILSQYLIASLFFMVALALIWHNQPMSAMLTGAASVVMAIKIMKGIL